MPNGIAYLETSRMLSMQQNRAQQGQHKSYAALQERLKTSK